MQNINRPQTTYSDRIKALILSILQLAARTSAYFSEIFGEIINIGSKFKNWCSLTIGAQILSSNLGNQEDFSIKFGYKNADCLDKWCISLIQYSFLTYLNSRKHCCLYLELVLWRLPLIICQKQQQKTQKSYISPYLAI